MTTDRRSFVRNAALGIASGAMAPTLTAEMSPATS
jgi:hypothetical protein